MYLPHNFINSICEKNNIPISSERIYVSSEIRKTKKTGNLFTHISNELKCKLSDIEHIGDNKKSDYEVPSKIGVNSSFYSLSHPNRYEKNIYKINQPVQIKSLLAGIPKAVRLRNSNELDNTIAEISSCVISPLIFSFVKWVIDKAEKEKIEKLYFLSRDGQLPFKIAKIYTEKYGINIKCCYLYASRQAWHFPSITEFDEENLKWILERTNFISIRTILQRVYTDPIEIEDILLQIGFESNTWDQNLNEMEILKFKTIFKIPYIVKLLLNKVDEKHRVTFQYLKQEGLEPDSSFAIVDIGWNGRLQRSLSRILNKNANNKYINIIGFYFCLERIYKAHKDDVLYVYSTSPLDKTHYYITAYKAVLELFFAADHGSTIGYEYTNGFIKPIFRNKKHNQFNWDISIQHKIVIEYSRLITKLLKADEINNIQLKDKALQNLRLFLGNPSFAESKYYGETIIFEDQNEEGGMSLATDSISVKDFIMWFLRRTGKVPLACWINASIVKSFPYFRFPFFILIELRIIFKKLLL